MPQTQWGNGNVNPAKFIAGGLIWMIRAYQVLLSPVLPGACRFHPTCSEYARQSVLRFGLMGGVWLAVKRILRCHPWADFGFDPVPGGAQATPLEAIPGEEIGGGAEAVSYRCRHHGASVH